MTPASITPFPSTARHDPSGRPLVVTDDPNLLDDLVRLADAADVTLDAIADPSLARRYWSAAPLAVVGTDRLRACIAADLPRHHRLIVATASIDDPTVWDSAVRLGAGHVVVLPDAGAWLVELFATVAPPEGHLSAAIGVVGGRGGAGATTLATALAVTARRGGLRTALVDADPFGGGVELALGPGCATIRRWSADVAREPLVIREVLADAARSGAGLVAMSWDRSSPDELPPETVASAVTGARKVADLVVVDLPRSADRVASIAARLCTTVLVVVPAEARAAAAASRVCARAGRMCADVRLVIRVPGPGALGPRQVTESLGLPVAGLLRAEHGLAAAMERGEAPGTRRRGPLAKLSLRLLADLLPRTDAVTA